MNKPEKSSDMERNEDMALVLLRLELISYEGSEHNVGKQLIATVGNIGYPCPHSIYASPKGFLE